MRTKYWLLLGVSAPLGAALGAVIGWFIAGIVLTAMHRGGHGDLAFAWMAAMFGLVTGTTLLPYLVYRRIRARGVNP